MFVDQTAAWVDVCMIAGKVFVSSEFSFKIIHLTDQT